MSEWLIGFALVLWILIKLEEIRLRKWEKEHARKWTKKRDKL